jgi:uncharacterized protein YhjY with autotransporter beta-barrel domain
MSYANLSLLRKGNRTVRFAATLTFLLVLSMIPFKTAHAIGNAASGLSYWNGSAGIVCSSCHTTPTSSASSIWYLPGTYTNSGQPLSYLATSGANIITAAANMTAGLGSSTNAATLSAQGSGVGVTNADDLSAYFRTFFPAPVISSSSTANAQVGTTYPTLYTIIASNSPVSFSISPALPTGLSLTTSTGVISGSPPASATTSTYTITATNAAGVSGTASLTITYSPVISSSAIASGTVGVSATQYTITASNSPTGYSLSSGALPAGTTLSGAIISGTPTAAGTFTPTLAATNAAGTGTLSVTFTIAKGSQAISFGAAPSVVVGGTGSVSVTGGASSSSVVLSVPTTTSICSVSGTTVTGLAVGTCTIAANQASDTNYNAATQVTQNITIGKGNQTISFGSAPSVVVGGTGSVSVTGGASTSPVVLNVPTTTSVCSVSGTTVTGIAAGTCTIAANQASDTNYNAAIQTTLTFTINKGSQSITFGTAPTVLVNGIGTVSATGGASTSTVVFSVPTTTSICSVLGNTVTGLSAGTCVVAANQASDTNYNAAPQVTQNIAVGLNPQSITFGTLPSITYPSTGAVSATGGPSGNAVTFTIPTTTTICSVSGNTVTALAAGTCTVAADQAGNTAYAAAAQITANITINKASQTVSFGAAPSVVVGSTGTVNATGTASGNSISFSVPTTTTVCSVSGTTVTGITAGTCTVAAVQAASSNYNASPQVTQNITIGPGSQTITFGAAPTIAYLGTGTVSATGGPSTSPVVFSVPTTTSICSVSGTTVTGLAAGTCVVAANQASDANYNAAPQVTQSITIGKSGQSISFGATPSVVVGGTGTVSATGGSSGNAVIFSSTTPLVCSVTNNTVRGLAIGTCTIAANQAGNSNLNAATANQNITIGQGSQTISFGPAPSLAVGGTATVSATASSGYSVTLTSTTTSICTISGVTVTGLKAGSCVIAANQAGDANYSAAPQSTLNITVSNLPPTAKAASMTTLLNTATTFDLAPSITGYGITGISIYNQPSHGTTSVNGTKVLYTPNLNYFGTDSFSYQAYNAGGKSNLAIVTITITGRPDPTKDTRVTGIVNTQTAAVMHFATVQVFNFQQRLESRHHSSYNPTSSGSQFSDSTGNQSNPVVGTLPLGGSQPAPVGGTVQGGNNNYFNSWNPNTTLNQTNDPNALLHAMDSTKNSGPNDSNPVSSLVANLVTGLATSSSLNLGSISNAAGTANNDSFSRLDIWAAGNIRFGTSTYAGVDTRFATDGVSVGADKRFTRKLTMGMGMGYAIDNSSIGTDGTYSKSTGVSMAGYGSYQWDAGTFLDGLLGYGKVDFDTNRYVPSVDDFARAARKGDQIFGSLSFGYDYRDEGQVISPYGRYDFSFDRLDPGTETGAGSNALFYDKQTVQSTSFSIGLRAQSAHQTDFGLVQPHARVEYQHSIQAVGDTSVAYADVLGTQYGIAGTIQKINGLVFGVGSDFLFSDSLKVSLDYERMNAPGTESYESINFKLNKTLNGKNEFESLLEESYTSSVTKPTGFMVSAGYSYDSNVTRASDPQDVRSDTIYSVSASKAMTFTTSKFTRLKLICFIDSEEFRTYTGLGHISGGGEGEFMYRTSGDFGAPTFGIFARFTDDAYESTLRDGTRTSAGVTLRQPLSDRISMFAAIANNDRETNTEVFNTKDVSARMNFDYAIDMGQTLYLTGEYRKGDIVSTGQPSLLVVDMSTVFIRDDVFTATPFYDYRMKGRTVLVTLGYNLSLGTKDSLDFSWRGVRSTPDYTPAYATPVSYTDNQYSISYLMVF